MIYLDNSATTRIKPKTVLSAVNQGLTKFSANGGRSGHTLSIETAIAINLVRQKVQKFFHVSKIEHVLFSGSCTESLNLAILGSCVKNGHVIATINEHNSVLRPLYHLKQHNLIDLSIAEPEKEDMLCWSDLEKHLKSNTYLICVNHVSNVDGMIATIKEIGKECKKRNIMLLVDAAQSAGHQKIDMQEDCIDFLAIAPHKGLYAPQGVGLLCISDTANLKPIKFGGTGTDSILTTQPTSAPECYESGTLPTPAILGLGAGIDFVEENKSDITEKIEDLSTFLNFELRKINNVIVYTHPNNSNGVIGFNIKNRSSEEVSNILNESYKICCRSGLHCAPLKHAFLNTVDTGIVRISISYFNNFGDIITLLKAVKKLAKDN